MLFRSNFMRTSEEYLMNAHKNQWLLTTPSPPAIPCGGTNQGTQHGVWRVDAFAVLPEMGQFSETRACKHLRTKRFHRVSWGNQQLYLLKSRYGKVTH